MNASSRAVCFFGIALAAIVAACALALPAPPARAASPVSNGRIAFESNRPFPGQPTGFSIYTVNADGSGLSAPLVEETSETTPAYSSDGTRIAWGTYLLEPPSCGGAHVIAVMNADGSNPYRVADRCDDYGSVNGTEFAYPAWSPDGSRLAFMCTNPFTSGQNVCLANSADGSGFAQLTDYAAFDSLVHPSWSPDGSKITYAVSTDGGATYEVHVIDADGSNDHAITPTPQIGWASDPAWSPDGTRIAFTGIDSDNHRRVFEMNPDGSDPVQLTASGTNSDDKQPAWSPDGKQLAFASSRVTATWNVWTMNADGTNLNPVTEDANQSDEPSWGGEPVGAPLLVPSASCSANTVTVGDTVSCTASATGGVTPYSFSWDVGGTAAGTGPDLSYVFTKAGLYVVDATVTDAVGASADFTIFITVQTAPPSVTIALTAPNGGSPNGQNGWFVTGPVTGTVTADASNTGGGNISSLDCGSLALSTSGIGTPTATGSFSISSEGVTHISCTATDSAGDKSDAATQDVQLDTAKPTLSPAVAPTPILLHATETATPNASDATSGVASQSCDPVDTGSAGEHTLTCAGTDTAGNEATASVDYVVQYQILGWFSPASQSKWKAGQTVPIKIALADADGTRIPDAEAQGLLSPSCRVTFGSTGAQATSACMKYDTAGHQFVYSWKLGPRAGNDTITATVTYPDTTVRTVLSEGIVIAS